MINKNTSLVAPQEVETSSNVTGTMSSLKTSKVETKRRYVAVTLEKRLALIDILENETVSIKEASSRLNLNYSTAKHILKNYKTTGSVHSSSIKRRYGALDHQFRNRKLSG